VDVHIGRLRSKIEPGSGTPRRLITVRGFGYKIDA
jgi:DNA-binding response OmpR family regulator